MSTKNVCFHGEIRKNIMWIHLSYFELIRLPTLQKSLPRFIIAMMYKIVVGMLKAQCSQGLDFSPIRSKRENT